MASSSGPPIALQPRAIGFERPRLRVDAGEVRREPLLIVAEKPARGGDHRQRHAEPLRDLDGEAAAGRAVDQPVGGRKRLRIERERRRHHAVGRRAPRLQRVVVRRRDDERAALLEVIDDGGRQRAAFVGIGAGADFVEQDERRQLAARDPSRRCW